MPTEARVRSTRQRAAVLGELERADDFLSAQDLHARLRAGGNGVGLSTVYRTLQALATSGEVDVLLTGEGEARYRSCSTGHHHHLVCRRCGRTVEVGGASVEQWAARIGREHGFSDVSHTLEVFGVCPSCAAATP
ncbi:MAG TPA: Fur family transcriptional regulator [Candidatus Nanopelagicales bacterium]